MENIDRVNRLGWAKFLLPPISILALPLLLHTAVRRRSLQRMARRYVVGGEEIPEDRRYGQMLSFCGRCLFFRDETFFFHFGRRMAHQQYVFVVNTGLDWNSMVVLYYLARNLRLPYPRFLLNGVLAGGRGSAPSLLWDLIDTFYGEGDLDRAIESRRSFIMEKSLLDRHPSVAEKIKNSHIPVVPICYSRPKKNRIWYVGGRPIKTSGFVSFRAEALVESVDRAFGGLVSLAAKLADGESRRRRMNPKGLFSLD